MPYERKTVDIYISDDLKRILQEIENDSMIANLLLKKRHDKEDMVEDHVNFLSLSKQDNRRISYLTTDRISALTPDEYWTSSRRYHAKPGSFLSKVFKNLPPKEVEKFSNLFKAEAVKPEFTFEVVSGQRIKDLYYWESYASDRGPLGISCMKHEQCQKFLDIYADNEEVSMLAMFNREGKLLGRALMWSFESYRLMDRIYTICDEEYSSYFKKWAVKNDVLHKKQQNWFNTLFFEQFGKKQIELKLKLKLKYNSYDHYPYMDTFKFLGDDGTLYNYQPDVSYRTLCATDGHRQGSDYLRFDSIAKVFRYPGDTVWLDYLSIYTHHDSCYYSESNDKYVLRTDTIYCDDAQDYIFNEENEIHNNRERIDDRIAYNKRREEERKKYEKASMKKKRSDLSDLMEASGMDSNSSFYNMYRTFSDSVTGRDEEVARVENSVSEDRVEESPQVETTSESDESPRPRAWSGYNTRPYFTFHSPVQVNRSSGESGSGQSESETNTDSSSDEINDILADL